MTTQRPRFGIETIGCNGDINIALQNPLVKIAKKIYTHVNYSINSLTERATWGSLQGWYFRSLRNEYKEK